MWPLELGIRTPTLRCGPLSWGYGLPHFGVEYNDVHGFYRAHIEHLLAQVWHWGIVRNIWRGSSTELHEYVCVLLHLQYFFIRRQVRYPPYCMWEHGHMYGPHLHKRTIMTRMLWVMMGMYICLRQLLRSALGALDRTQKGRIESVVFHQ